jgi:conjugative transfer signal peptidase TraF
MRRSVGVFGLLTLVGLLTLKYHAPIIVNLSKSLPRGFYVRSSSPVTVGKYVVFCAQKLKSGAWIVTRRYTGAGSCTDGTAPLIKPVAAIGPSRVFVTDKGVRIGEKLATDSLPLKTDSNLKPLPVLRGEIRVPEDALFLLSTYHRLSLDSRYFGPVPISAVNMVVDPLFTEDLLWGE